MHAPTLFSPAQMTLFSPATCPAPLLTWARNQRSRSLSSTCGGGMHALESMYTQRVCASMYTEVCVHRVCILYDVYIEYVYSMFVCILYVCIHRVCVRACIRAVHVLVLVFGLERHEIRREYVYICMVCTHQHWSAGLRIRASSAFPAPAERCAGGVKKRHGVRRKHAYIAPYVYTRDAQAASRNDTE
jgi:hypothetical protein